MFSQPFSSWHALPSEMKLSIIDYLDSDNVVSLSKVDQRTYHACVPALFKTIKLGSHKSLENFLENVPRHYYSCIEDLFLCTKNESIYSCPVLPRARADSIISLLSATPRLRKLVLQVEGSLHHSVLSPFPFLTNLTSLSVINSGDEVVAPLSERFVVHMAASTRHLEELVLDRITRSKVHAPELDGAYPCPPLAINDTDIPEHPLLGAELYLPSLLRIPTLRKLTIRDTHLGHELWTTVPVACRLEVLDLGSCYHENDCFNTRCTERIMAAVGPSVDEFALTTAVSDDVFSKPSLTPLQKLRKLHISPFFPLDSVVETMSNLAGSPVEGISVQCFEEDIVDICSALKDFLILRRDRGSDFYNNLKRIDVSVASSDDVNATVEEKGQRWAAARHLQCFCHDLQLASAFDRFDRFVAEVGEKINVGEESSSFTAAKRFPVKSRSMTI